MNRSRACRIIPTALKRAVVTAASLMFCLAPAWPHDPDRMARDSVERDWMERGWIYLAQIERDDNGNLVLVDPARITDEEIYWDAISQICISGRNCLITFYPHVSFLRYQPDTSVYTDPSGSDFRERAHDSIMKNSLAMFYQLAESGEGILLFSCHTIEIETCY